MCYRKYETNNNNNNIDNIDTLSGALDHCATNCFADLSRLFLRNEIECCLIIAIPLYDCISFEL